MLLFIALCRAAVKQYLLMQIHGNMKIKIFLNLKILMDSPNL